MSELLCFKMFKILKLYFRVYIPDVSDLCVSQYVFSSSHISTGSDLWSVRSCSSRLFFSFEVKWCDYLCVLWLGDRRQHWSEQRAKFLVSQPHKRPVMLSVSAQRAKTCFLWSESVGDTFVCQFIFIFCFFSCVPVVFMLMIYRWMM